MDEEPSAHRASGWRLVRWHLLVIALLHASVFVVLAWEMRQPKPQGTNWIVLDLRGVYAMLWFLVVSVLSAPILLHLFVARLRRRFDVGIVIASCGIAALLSFFLGTIYLAAK